MRKKFKRSVKAKMTVQNKQRRIMSALLAVSVFASGGMSGKFLETGFTAVAEDAPEIIVEPNITENPDSKQTDSENDSEQADKDIKAVVDDTGTKPPEKNEENNNKGENDNEQNVSDAGISMLADDGGGENPPDKNEDTDSGGGDSETTDEVVTEADGYKIIRKDVKPMIKVQPEINGVDSLSPWHMGFEKWETQETYNENNAYILRGADTVTVCGVTGNFKFVTEEEFEENKSDAHYHKITNDTGVYYIETAASVWLADKQGKMYDEWTETKQGILYPKRNTYPSYEIVFEPVMEAEKDADGNEIKDNNGNTVYKQIGVNPVLRVYMTYEGSENVTNETIAHGKVVFNNGVDWESGLDVNEAGWQEFHIGVRPRQSFIEVYSKVADRDMNEVNEYVYDANLSDEQKLNVNGEHILNSEATPYMLHAGESVYINGFGKKPISDTTTQVETIGVWHNSNFYEDHTYKAKYNSKPFAESDKTYTEYTVEGEAGKFCLKYDTGYDDLDGERVYEKFYFSIYDQTSWRGDFYDHADIEIADNNTYTAEVQGWGWDKSGNPVLHIYEIVYDVYVSDIESSQIYGKDGKPLVLKDQYYDDWDWESNTGVYSSNQYDKPRMRNDGVIPGTDYWKDPTKKPGDTQFELTSKYARDIEWDSNGNVTKNELSYPSINDNLRFKMSDVDTVDFHVELYLKPKSITVYDAQRSRAAGDGRVPCQCDTYSIDDISSVTINNVTFKMDHQSVLDAYNKCPDHSGLDFTFNEDISDYIKVTPTLCPFEAGKELKNGKLEKEQFKFTLSYNGFDLEEEYLNDIDGNIYFDNRIFNEEGTYTYRIEEVQGSDKTIVYDKGYVEVEVQVSKTQTPKQVSVGGSDVMKTVQEVGFTVDSVTYKKYNSKGEPVEDVTNQFTNYKIYELPAAGGTGTYLYIISGTGLMLSAAVMYRRRRKEE